MHLLIAIALYFERIHEFPHNQISKSAQSMPNIHGLTSIIDLINSSVPMLDNCIAN
ncbi:MAG: hypothetical protein KME29_31720 [Calothrix sp. FI2-JRJ7]|nr:hypothetical protein [Calothrix sp. FI2-JRJ7]